MTPNLRNDSPSPAWSVLLFLLPVVLSLSLLMLASFLSWPLQAHSALDDRQVNAEPPPAVSTESGIDHSSVVGWDAIDVSADPSPLSVAAYGQ
jgi:hypothetical protein